jgi:hypothetical protein
MVLKANMYFALMMDNIIMGCLLFDKPIVAFSKRDSNPIVEHPVSKSTLQFKS